MKYLYVPVYKMAVSYLFNFGRRWSILEHILLAESTIAKRTAMELAIACNVPHRLVVEALINLLRANYIEVRSDDTNVYFAATPTGQRRAHEKSLPEQLQRDVRWDSVCVDRLTGHWMRTDDLDLIYEKDLPDDALKLQSLLYTFEPNDAALRDLFRLNVNESLEPTAPLFRPSSLAYARIGLAFDTVQMGLPTGAPLALRSALVEASHNIEDDGVGPFQAEAHVFDEQAYDNLTSDDLIVGGDAHVKIISEALENSKSSVVIHSCFLSATTLRKLLPDFERAGRRRVKIDLLWGLHADPEDEGPSKKISDAINVLSELQPGARGRVNLSQMSSRSHAKVLLYDDRNTGKWTTIVGSCNFLSSDFDWMEVSLRTRSPLFSAKVASWMLSGQLPAVGNWSGTARRLNTISSELKRLTRGRQETGTHRISLVMDNDHYTCIALARDRACEDIEIVCDLYGLSAETSVLVPMETAAKRGIKVKIRYTRGSRFLLAERAELSPEEVRSRGIDLGRVKDVHAKYLAWDGSNLVITSFNWMATSTDGKRYRGAEVGALIEGPDIRAWLLAKLEKSAIPKVLYEPVPTEGPIPS